MSSHALWYNRAYPHPTARWKLSKSFPLCKNGTYKLPATDTEGEQGKEKIRETRDGCVGERDLVYKFVLEILKTH